MKGVVALLALALVFPIRPLAAQEVRRVDVLEVVKPVEFCVSMLPELACDSVGGHDFESLAPGRRSTVLVLPAAVAGSFGGLVIGAVAAGNLAEVTSRDYGTFVLRTLAGGVLGATLGAAGGAHVVSPDPGFGRAVAAAAVGILPGALGWIVGDGVGEHWERMIGFAVGQGTAVSVVYYFYHR